MLSSAILLGSLLLGQPGDSVKTVAALRITAAEGTPVLDGRLDEEVWKGSETASGFVQLAPRPGAPASQPTEARVLYAPDALYVGVRMFDSRPDSIAAQLGRRDQEDIYSDWIHVGIDSYNDNRTAFRFSVNPRGVKADAYHFDDTGADRGWDAVWEVATSIDSLGWSAEFRIPLSQLRFSDRGQGEQVWGINFARKIARLEEESFWSPMEPNSGRVVSSFGELHGLRGLRSPGRLEVQPYSVGRLERAPGDGSNPFHHATDAVGSFGADLKYGVTSDFTLTATINPDFGQVEADPAEVNLTAYESFFPEKRPFFVEGTDIFRFGIGAGDGDFGNEQLFYSRRIGRQPQGGVDPDAEFVDAPDATTILGAAKLSGKTSNGWSIGLMEALTSREEARFVLPGDPDPRAATTEPLTNYSVARAIKSFDAGRTAVGGIVTATHRQREDGLEFLPSASYAGGIDARHRFGGGRFEIRSWLLGSRVEGDTAAIARLQRSPARRFHRPDADHLDYDPSRTSLTGWAASTEVLKISGGNWRYGGILNLRSPGFEVNDLGYQREADAAVQALFASYQQFQPGPVLRRWSVGGSQWSGWSFGGERGSLGANLHGDLQLRSYWGAHGGITYEGEALSIGALRGGPAIVKPAGYNTWFGVYSDRRKPVSVSLNGGNSQEAESGSHSWRLSTGLDLRPSSRIELSLRPAYSRNVQAWQYIGAESLGEEPRYLFGRLDQTTASLTTRLSYTFSPELSLQLYAQPFVSAGGFSDFRAVADPRAPTFERRLPRFARTRDELAYDAAAGKYRADVDGDGVEDVAFADPDFSSKQFRSNLVLRWEYRPGSTLFVVWSQGREDFLNDGSFALRRDAGRLFGMDAENPVPATNVLLVKLNYWLSL